MQHPDKVCLRKPLPVNKPVPGAPFCNHATKQTRKPKLDFSCEHFAASGKQQTKGDKLLAKAAAAF